jgi:formylglycine-generating enzyme required for sulfatase activity
MRVPARCFPFVCGMLWMLALVGCREARHPNQATGAPEGMVFVPAGPFPMGRDDGPEDERPARTVHVDAFSIDRTEVTNAQYKALCDSTRHLYPNNPAWDIHYFVDKPDSPVINITWEQAKSYCEWAGKQLPTEAQWEKAARGAEGRIYPWGNEYIAGRANMASPAAAGPDSSAPDGDAYYRAAPVGSFPEGASPYGALDMAGNVWEWCADWFDHTYYPVAPAKNPTGPAEPKPWRSVRGGGFSSPPSDAVASNRSKHKPDGIIHHLGCRCVWAPK